MKQILQYQKSGEIEVREVPAPGCLKGGILVRTSSSIISAGTEKFSVENAKSSMLERARRQPDQVRLVLDYVKKEGILSTYKRVRSALDSFKQLGYSASGEVVQSDCDEFSPGDRVACAGAGYANHAEFITVPKNLAVKLPGRVSYEEAAFATVGAIAMQGVRQANPQIGETIAVIGLGLLGQLTIQILKAAGCRVVGFDISAHLFDIAKENGCDIVLPSDRGSIQKAISFSRGHGCDSVIVAASTKSNQPIELAFDISRKRGLVVIVGAVGMNIPRAAVYKKELEVKMSTSYGPGRYDADYEERGNDYPLPFVRWTENRNMQSFLDLIDQGMIDVKPLITHRYTIDNAVKAYELITKGEEKYLGIILNYIDNADQKRTINNQIHKQVSDINIAMLGAGIFAKNHLLPALKSNSVGFAAVTTASPVNAETVAAQYGFSTVSTASLEVIDNKDVNAVFCATRHDSHGQIVLKAIKVGKPIFIEKPLCVSHEELKKIEKAVSDKKSQVMVGYNRRFSEPFIKMKEFFKGRSQPMSLIYRVNAGKIPKSHWIHDKSQRGRIIGEVCHFIDAMIFLSGELPVCVYADSITSVSEEQINKDTVNISIKFSGGSIGSINYFANGPKSLAKEYLEVYSEQSAAIMNDFRSLSLFDNNSEKNFNYSGDKGIKKEIDKVIESIRNGEDMPIKFMELRATSLATFAVIDSLRTGDAICL